MGGCFGCGSAVVAQKGIGSQGSRPNSAGHTSLRAARNAHSRHHSWVPSGVWRMTTPAASHALRTSAAVCEGSQSGHPSGSWGWQFMVDRCLVVLAASGLCGGSDSALICRMEFFFTAGPEMPQRRLRCGCDATGVGGKRPRKSGGLTGCPPSIACRTRCSRSDGRPPSRPPTQAPSPDSVRLRQDALQRSLHLDGCLLGGCLAGGRDGGRSFLHRNS